MYEPAAKIRQGFPNQMTTYQGRINDKELRALIAYMKSVSDGVSDFDPEQTWGSLDPEAEDAQDADTGGDEPADGAVGGDGTGG